MSNPTTLKEKEYFEEKQSAKRAAVLGMGKGKKRPLYFIFIPLCLGLLVLAFSYFFNKETTAQSVAGADQVVHPANLFEDGRARHFQLDTKDGPTIKYFVIKSSDGVIRAAFDACDVCWPSGKGYVQDGDYMVCRNCGKRFASIKVNEVKGGCNPAPLKRELVGNNLVIRVKDILEGRQYFDFSRKG